MEEIENKTMRINHEQLKIDFIEALDERGQTQVQAAKEMGMTYMQLYNILTGKTTNPTIKNLYAICNYNWHSVDNYIEF